MQLPTASAANDYPSEMTLKLLCKLLRGLAVAWLFSIACSASLHAGNWPQWRGPSGNSTSREGGLPLVWRETFNLVWKVELPGWGNSTPIIWEDAVFVTSQQDDKLLLLRLDKKTGKTVWTRQVGTGASPEPSKPRRGEQVFHRLHNLASPSPVTDGKTVVAHFGNGDLAAYDFDGKRLWRRNLQQDHGRYTIWWGHSNSPVIYRDFVISVCMQDSLADVREQPSSSYLVAHDLKKGHLRWQTKRMTGAKAEEGDAYTTPVFLVSGDRVQMVVMGGNQLDAYNPDTGEQIWFLPGLRGGRTVTGPTVAGQFVIATRGFRGAMHAMKIKPSHKGKLRHRVIAWSHGTGSPDSCCPVVWADLCFTITDDGVARCFNGFNGRLHWKRRLKGKYKASPLAGQNRIYFLNQEGLCTVISASPQFLRLVENRLDDQTIASPAISDGKIFIRGRRWLYCLGQN